MIPGCRFMHEPSGVQGPEATDGLELNLKLEEYGHLQQR